MKKIIILIMFVISSSIYSLDFKYIESSFGFRSPVLAELNVENSVSLGVSEVIEIKDYLLIGSNLYWMMGLREYSPNFDYPCPHNDWSVYDELRTSNGFSIGAEIGTDIDISERFSLFILLGPSISYNNVTSKIVSRSNITNWTYMQGDSNLNLNKINYGISIRGGYSYKPFTLSWGYNSLIGFNINMGLRF